MQIQGLRFDVIAYVQVHGPDSGGEEGFIVCDRGNDFAFAPFASWRIGLPHNSDPILWHGHYFASRDEAIANMNERARYALTA